MVVQCPKATKQQSRALSPGLAVRSPHSKRLRVSTRAAPVPGAVCWGGQTSKLEPTETRVRDRRRGLGAAAGRRKLDTGRRESCSAGSQGPRGGAFEPTPGRGEQTGRRIQGRQSGASAKGLRCVWGIWKKVRGPVRPSVPFPAWHDFGARRIAQTPLPTSPPPPVPHACTCPHTGKGRVVGAGASEDTSPRHPGPCRAGRGRWL